MFNLFFPAHKLDWYVRLRSGAVCRCIKGVRFTNTSIRRHFMETISYILETIAAYCAIGRIMTMPSMRRKCHECGLRNASLRLKRQICTSSNNVEIRIAQAVRGDIFHSLSAFRTRLIQSSMGWQPLKVIGKCAAHSYGEAEGMRFFLASHFQRCLQ